MKILKHALLASITIAAIFSCTHSKKVRENENKQASEDGDMFLLAGTYTSEEGSKGIYVYRFNTETGVADSVSMIEVKNPSYLTLSPDERFVYAVGENGDNDSYAHAFAFDKKTGTLAHLNSQNTQGASPCYVETDAKGQNVYTANYGGGSISSFIVNADGSLSTLNSLLKFEGTGVDKERQKAPYLHCVRLSPDGNYLFATDLGLDKIYRYRITGSVFEGQPSFSDNDGKTFDVSPLTGPRHFHFHPNGQYMYLLGELSGEITVFEYNKGNIAKKQTIAADTVGGRGSADIHTSPDGRFLYASNRLKNDGIAIFSIHQQEGTLTKAGYQPTGKHPRNFVITPNGKFLLVASRDENKIQVFSIDAQTGLLTDTHRNILLNKPVCLKFATME